MQPWVSYCNRNSHFSMTLCPCKIYPKIKIYFNKMWKLFFWRPCSLHRAFIVSFSMSIALCCSSHFRNKITLSVFWKRLLFKDTVYLHPSWFSSSLSSLFPLSLLLYFYFLSILPIYWFLSYLLCSVPTISQPFFSFLSGLSSYRAFFVVVIKASQSNLYFCFVMSLCCLGCN